MPRTADKTDIPRRLTEAGYRLFTKDGYNATGIQQIADAAGVPKGSFYNHFDSKEAFAAAIIRHYATWVNESWDQCLTHAPTDALPRILHLFERFIAHHAQTACQGCLVGNFAAEVSETSLVCRSVLRDALAHWHARLAELIQAAQAEGTLRSDISAQAMSTLIWDSWEGALLRMKVEQTTAPLQDTIHLLLHTVLRTSPAL